MSSPADTSTVIERWAPDAPRPDALRQVVASEQQTRNLAFEAEWHRSSHLLVALRGPDIVGFLRFVVQEIGPDNEQPAVHLDGVALLEAKILAFGVVAGARRGGVGTGLQRMALAWARELGCYQVRSHSGGENRANHRLKLGMGFAVHPVVRGDDDRGAYFIMPLRPLSGRDGGERGIREGLGRVPT